jgi:hypothetical protein
MNGTLVEGNRIRVLWGKSSNPSATKKSSMFENSSFNQHGGEEDSEGRHYVPTSSIKSQIEEMEEKRMKEIQEQQDYYAKLHAYYYYMRAVQSSIPLNTFDVNEENQKYISTHQSSVRYNF